MAPARAGSRRTPKVPGKAPRMLTELSLHDRGWVSIAGADEVGRGALSGPVTVGVVVVTAGIGAPPRGLRDSKLLTPEQRLALVPRIQRWVSHSAVAHASNDEIDAIGIIAALRLAGRRALAALDVPVDGVLLDGNHDYLTGHGAEPVPGEPEWPGLPVHTQIKADMRCASVAAASILAKTTRDAIMVGVAADYPEYGWHENKGYATVAHRSALLTHGPSPLHRRSWNLTGAPVDIAGSPDDVVDLTGEPVPSAAADWVP